MGSAERLAALRSLLQDHGLSAYIVPSEDAHQSEYTAEHDKRRAFLTGFTGSAGIAVVTHAHALLWTDGRYHLQARQQLQGEWKLMKLGEDASPEDWLAKESGLPPGAKVGVDPTTVSLSSLKLWEKRLEEAQLAVKRLEQNLVDQLWKDRPSPPKTTTRIQPESLAGRSVSKKLKELREALEKEKAGALVVTALDEVAWLYNIRGEDVLYSPVVHAYAFVTKSRAILYMDPDKVTDEVARHLEENGVTVKPYHGRTILDDITLFGSGADAATGKLWLDPASANAAIGKVLPEGQLIEKASPLALAKAVKNPVELEGLRAAHVRDAVALVQFMEWLDTEVQQQFGVSGYFSSTGHTNKRKRNEEHGRVHLTEVTLADKLESFRARQQHFVGLSFPTISSVGSNAAIIHYGPQRDTCADFDPAKIYLCDSGAQYLDGTTDVTRTFHFGTPSDHEKECFTRVLKGHIGLDTVIFPSGTTGHMLDALARLPLWRAGLDYRHGTGHGVGSFLFVHEGPHLISFKPTASNAGIKANMTVTNEPGYYEDGAFGCRIENVLVVKEVKLANNFANKGYLGFEPITLVPLQAKLIDTSLLTGEELAWVDAYHATCREKLSPLLTGVTLEWLVKATSPITQAG